MSYFGKPQVGTEVEVITRWRSIYIYRTSEFDEFTYKGRVVVRHKNTPATSFAIVDEQGTFREIPLSHCVVLRYKDGTVVRAGKTATQASKVAEVRYITGSKGDTYILTKFDGKITCNCPGATFRGACKHTGMFDKAATSQ